MKTLLIIDFQYDFCDPNGSLYVPGAEEAEDAVVKHINSDEEIGNVVFTLDWHPSNHCSFKINGGQWPVHCLQYSQGAGISPKIMNACIEKKLPIKFVLKGNKEDKEEYGAFSERFNVNGNKPTEVDNYFDFRNKDIEVCGLALDYCVKETLRNLYIQGYKEHIINSLSIFMDGTKAINPDSNEVKVFFERHPEIKKV